ncbi:MAG: hypothetical protein ACK6CT_11400 [Planctomycetia bacterium]
MPHAIRPRSGRGAIAAAAVGCLTAILVAAGSVGPQAADGKEVEASPAPPASLSPPQTIPQLLVPPPEATAAAVLDLHGNGFSVGSLLDAPAAGDGPRTTLLWKSELFATPLELAIPEIVRVRFPRRKEVLDRAGAWRFELQGGDVILGTLEGIDAERFTVNPLDIGTGPLQIRRVSVERMRRLEGGVRTIVPGGLEGWDAARGVWQEQKGMLATDQPNAVAYRDVGAPAKACYDVVLTWTVRPEFDLFVAADAEFAADLKQALKPASNPKRAHVDQYRLQASGQGKLQAWREAAKADFEEIAGLAVGGGRLHVQLFVDQESGRMAVTIPQDGRPAGPPVFDKTIAARKAVRPGFAVKVRKGTLRIDSLRVVPWDGGQPRLEPVVGLGSATAVLESFDRATGEFVVRDGEETGRVTAAAAGELEFDAAPAATPPDRGPAPVLLGFSAGSRLTGSVREIAKDTVTLDSPLLVGPLACPVDRLSLLESAGMWHPRPLPGRVGLLAADTDRMLGCVEQANGVGWQPWGAVAPARFAAAASAKISFRGTPLLGGAGISVAKQGNAWAVTEIAPGGPAARHGRIQRGWKLEAIQLLPGGQPLPAAGLKLDEVVGLLRGIIGSSVGLRLTDPSGQAEEVTLVRDRAGRGDVTSPEQDLLEAALKIHDDKSGIKAGIGPAGSLVTLKTGDVISCTVIAGDADGLRVKTDRGDEVLIPNALLRAAELLNPKGGTLTAQKKERLTTLPRLQLADPPTHLIRLDSGDYLRGKMLSLDAETVKFRVLEETKQLPRAALARIIWLSVAGDNADQKAVEMIAGGAGLPVQGVATNKRRLTIAAEQVKDGILIGTAGPLGRLPIDLRTCEALFIGAAIAAQPPLANDFKTWELKPAKLPAALLQK